MRLTGQALRNGPKALAMVPLVRFPNPHTCVLGFRTVGSERVPEHMCCDMTKVSTFHATLDN